MAADERGFKRSSGDGDDPGKALRKWRTWAQAKMATVKDLTAKQKGPWLFTLLDNLALEACEHLSLEEMMQEDGEKKILELLQARFPEKEPHDQMGEALGEVFGLAAKEGESMKEWTARVGDTFERCKRKAAVDFPKEARGWIALHCASLTEEQKAIVKAKTQGALDLETISAGIRSCFPQLKASGMKSKRPTNVLAVEKEPPSELGLLKEPEAFEDVEALLADYGMEEKAANPDDEGPLSESEVAEALAVSWKERRHEIGRMQKARQFGSADAARRSFRIEVEELKKRTRCRRCGKLGHWQKECRSKAPANPARSSQDAGIGSNRAQSETLMEADDSFRGSCRRGSHGLSGFKPWIRCHRQWLWEDSHWGRHPARDAAKTDGPNRADGQAAELVPVRERSR